MEDTAMFANTQVATARVIHTPSAFSRESLLHLQEAGMLRALAPHVSRRENLPSYLCFLVTAGAGSRSFPARPTGRPGMRSCCASRTRPWRRSGRTAAFPMPTILPEASKKSRALPQRTTADSGKCRTRKLSAIQKHPGAGAHRLCIRSRDVFEKSQAATLTSRLRLSKKGCALF